MCGSISETSAVYNTGEYFFCPECKAIFLNASSRLVPDEEKLRYLEHDNTLANEGYRRYLEEIIEALEKAFPDAVCPPLRVLDWGCGPVPSLVALFEQRAYTAYGYDPYFFPTLPQPGITFPLITCIEVAEHFAAPRTDFSLISSYLSPGGILALRTNLHECEYPDFEPFFSSWWYRQDKTHCTLYSRRALETVALSAGLVSVSGHSLEEKGGKHLYLFTKNVTDSKSICDGRPITDGKPITDGQR